MAFRDNREFITALEKTGDVVTIDKEVDWDMEAGAIARKMCEAEGPAVLFNKIKDYPEGYRIFSAPGGTYRRVAVAFGLPPETPTKEIFRIYEERMKDTIPPVIVKGGPCKENKMWGDSVDLYKLPSPMCHDGDGGRYIGTWGFVVCKDPDSDWVNWGMYRFHINNKHSLAMKPAPGSNLGSMFREKFMPNNKPMQISCVIGADPLSSIASSAGYPVGSCEVELAGALRQEPVELIKCETNDLFVPAHAEIILEGEILPDRSAAEGPFGEYPGYRSPGFEPMLYCKVNMITHRNNPIHTMSNLGVPVDDSHVGGCISNSISIKKKLEKKGIPVIDAFQSPEGAAFLLVVSVSKGGPEVVKAVGDAIGKRRAWISKILVVDKDVDVFDIRQVVHAFAVKCHPIKGVYLRETPEGTGNPFSPLTTAKELRTLKGAVALMDATWDPDRPEDEIPVKANFDEIYPEEVKNRVLQNWEAYGID